MIRRALISALATGSAALVALAATSAPTSAQTGIAGEVPSVVEVSFDGKQAAVNATVPGTGLWISPGGRQRALRSFPAPVSGARVTVPDPRPNTTITFGPQTP